MTRDPHARTGVVEAGLDRSLDTTVVPGFSRIGLAVRRRLPGWPADPAANALVDKHIAATGATSGLGRQTVQDLLALGAMVHLVVRDVAKAERVVGELSAEVPQVRERCRVWQCDMGDLASARGCAGSMAEAMTNEGWQLHGLVHNAGAMPPERTESAQGHELSMAIHVLGPVAFTDVLAQAGLAPERVVMVTSGGMYTQALPLEDPEYRWEPYRPATAYARSKRAQVDLLSWFAARWPQSRVYAMHPGWADTPGVTQSLPLFNRLTGPILRTPSEGADTTVWLLAAEPAPPAGGLWHDRRERPTTRLARTRSTPQEVAVFAQWVEQALAG